MCDTPVRDKYRVVCINRNWREVQYKDTMYHLQVSRVLPYFGGEQRWDTWRRVVGDYVNCPHRSGVLIPVYSPNLEIMKEACDLLNFVKIPPEDKAVYP